MASNSLADTTTRDTWRRAARKATARWNIAWWLDRAGPLLVGVSLLGAGTLLYLRSQNIDVDFSSKWPWIASGFVIVMAIAWALARGHFATDEKSMVRLESQMQLNNALTAAEQGVRPWPSPMQNIDDGIHWNWAWVLSPFLVAAGLLVAAYLIPIKPPPEIVDTGTQGPRGWEQIENAIQELEKNETIEPKSLEQLKEKLSKLKNQPKNEWFSHSSMEATDNLKQSLRDASSKMADNLEQAGESLSTLEKFGDQMSPKAKEKLMEEFKDAVDKLGSGDLKPNKELMDQLSQVDPSEFQNQLSPEQMQELMDNLKKNQEACENASGQNGEGQGEGPLSDEEQDLMSLLDDDGNFKDQRGKGKGKGRQPGEDEGGPDAPADPNAPGGRGGVNEGGGPTDLTLKDEKTDLGTKNHEGVKSKDISRALPRDLVKIGKGRHNVDKANVGPREAGGVKSTGEGGEAVWKDSLLPKEKSALKRYFK